MNEPTDQLARHYTAVQPASFLPAVTVPVHITDFSIAGRLLVGFRLVQRTPGVSGVDISFEEKPTVNVSIRPMGRGLVVPTTQLKFCVPVINSLDDQTVTRFCIRARLKRHVTEVCARALHTVRHRRCVDETDE